MNYNDLKFIYYTAYILKKSSRDHLLELFPPKYSKVIAHHVTDQFDVNKNTFDKSDARSPLEVIGYMNNDDGIEALIVSIGGSVVRQDGSIYHITWSLDPEKFKPKDSNKFIRELGYQNIDSPIIFDATYALQRFRNY